VKTHPFDLPVIRVELRLADGSVIEREWSINDGPPKPFPPPARLLHPSRKWDKPQGPITIAGDVEPGFEDIARGFVEGLSGMAAT
jgi:hypothetical protein